MDLCVLVLVATMTALMMDTLRNKESESHVFYNMTLPVAVMADTRNMFMMKMLKTDTEEQEVDFQPIRNDSRNGIVAEPKRSRRNSKIMATSDSFIGLAHVKRKDSVKDFSDLPTLAETMVIEKNPKEGNNKLPISVEEKEAVITVHKPMRSKTQSHMIMKNRIAPIAKRADSHIQRSRTWSKDKYKRSHWDESIDKSVYKSVSSVHTNDDTGPTRNGHLSFKAASIATTSSFVMARAITKEKSYPDSFSSEKRRLGLLKLITSDYYNEDIKKEEGEKKQRENQVEKVRKPSMTVSRQASKKDPVEDIPEEDGISKNKSRRSSVAQPKSKMMFASLAKKLQVKKMNAEDKDGVSRIGSANGGPTPKGFAALAHRIKARSTTPSGNNPALVKKSHMTMADVIAAAKRQQYQQNLTKNRFKLASVSLMALQKLKIGKLGDSEDEHLSLPSEARFSAMLSPAAQCAMLKCYEDMVYDNLVTVQPETEEKLERPNSASGVITTVCPAVARKERRKDRIKNLSVENRNKALKQQGQCSKEQATKVLQGSANNPQNTLEVPGIPSTSDYSPQVPKQSLQPTKPNPPISYSIEVSPRRRGFTEEQLRVSYRMNEALDILDDLKKTQGLMVTTLRESPRKEDPIESYQTWCKKWPREFEIEEAKLSDTESDTKMAIIKAKQKAEEEKAKAAQEAAEKAAKAAKAEKGYTDAEKVKLQNILNVFQKGRKKRFRKPTAAT